jgi:hypothetical protein
MGAKDGRCVGLTNLLHLYADCLEIWKPQLLKPPGLVQACNGIALPLLYLGHDSLQYWPRSHLSQLRHSEFVEPLIFTKMTL